MIKIDDRIKNITDNNEVLIQQDIDQLSTNLGTTTIIKELLRTNDWINIIDGLNKVSDKLNTYIREETTEDSDLENELREYISELQSLVGVMNKSELANNGYKSLIEGIVELKKLTGLDEINQEVLKSMNFSDLVDGLIQLYQSCINNASNILEVSNINTVQIDAIAGRLNNFQRSLNSIQEVLNRITGNIEGITLPGTDINTEEYNQSLQDIERINQINTNLISLIGTVTVDWEKSNYSSIIDAILTLTRLMNEVEDKVSKTILSFNSQSLEFDRRIKTLEVDSTVNLDQISQLIKSIEKISESILDLRTEILDLRYMINKHNSDPNAHPNSSPSFLFRSNNTNYTEGESFYIKGYPNYYRLICIQDGISGSEIPEELK